MFNKLKRAYISIEAVILASIVIIGGLCGLSAFLKNGQNAQSQSAEAMNNVIDMIGEEFGFSIGSGELPGGGGLPGGGETPEESELNEYGFYYEKKYFAEDSDAIYLIFFSDGTHQLYNDSGYLGTDTWTYDGGAIVMAVGTRVNIASNGKQLIESDGTTWNLQESDTNQIYFNREYVGYLPPEEGNTQMIATIFDNKDIVVRSIIYDLPANKFTYSNNSAEIEGTIGTFTSTGSSISGSSGTFNLIRVPAGNRNIYGFFYDEIYAMDMGGGQYYYIIFRENGSAEIGICLYAPGRYVQVENNKIYIEDEVYGTISSNGKKVLFSGIEFTLQ